MQAQRTPRKQPRRLTLDSANDALIATRRVADLTQQLNEIAAWYMENIPGDAPTTYAQVERASFRDEGGREQWKALVEELPKRLDPLYEFAGDKRVALTDLERRCLVLAASEVTDHPDAMDAAFPDPAEKRAVLRAVEKLRA